MLARFSQTLPSIANSSWAHADRLALGRLSPIKHAAKTDTLDNPERSAQDYRGENHHQSGYAQGPFSVSLDQLKQLYAQTIARLHDYLRFEMNDRGRN